MFMFLNIKGTHDHYPNISFLNYILRNIPVMSSGYLVGSLSHFLLYFEISLLCLFALFYASLEFSHPVVPLNI